MTTPLGHFSSFSRNSIFGFLILIELEIINSWRAWQVEVDFDFILFIIIHLLGIVRYIPIWKKNDLQRPDRPDRLPVGKKSGGLFSGSTLNRSNQRIYRTRKGPLLIIKALQLFEFTNFSKCLVLERFAVLVPWLRIVLRWFSIRSILFFQNWKYFKPKMSLLIQNHKNDNQGEFWWFSLQANCSFREKNSKKFPHKWHFRLWNENFEISQNSA